MIIEAFKYRFVILVPGICSILTWTYWSDLQFSALYFKNVISYWIARPWHKLLQTMQKDKMCTKYSCYNVIKMRLIYDIAN